VTSSSMTASTTSAAAVRRAPARCRCARRIVARPRLSELRGLGSIRAPAAPVAVSPAAVIPIHRVPVVILGLERADVRIGRVVVVVTSVGGVRGIAGGYALGVHVTGGRHSEHQERSERLDHV
jgi:hypothetical protein